MWSFNINIYSLVISFQVQSYFLRDITRYYTFHIIIVAPWIVHMTISNTMKREIHHLCDPSSTLVRKTVAKKDYVERTSLHVCSCWCASVRAWQSSHHGTSLRCWRVRWKRIASPSYLGLQRGHGYAATPAEGEGPCKTWTFAGSTVQTWTSAGSVALPTGRSSLLPPSLRLWIPLQCQGHVASFIIFLIFQCFTLFPSLNWPADQLIVLLTICVCFSEGINIIFL
jgi:hypothetical protein